MLFMGAQRPAGQGGGAGEELAQQEARRLGPQGCAIQPPPWDTGWGSGHEKAQAKKRPFELGHQAESALKAVEVTGRWGCVAGGTRPGVKTGTVQA